MYESSGIDGSTTLTQKIQTVRGEKHGKIGGEIKASKLDRSIEKIMQNKYIVFVSSKKKGWDRTVKIKKSNFKKKLGERRTFPPVLLLLLLPGGIACHRRRTIRGPSVRRRGPLAMRMAAAVAGGGRRAGWGKMWGGRTFPQLRTNRSLEGTSGNYAGGSLPMEVSPRSDAFKPLHGNGGCL